MDSIAGYSSDTSDSSDNEPDTQLPSPDFSPFSENYLGNNNMAGIFLHIPWNPPIQVANQLKTIAYDALKHLRQHHPEYVSSFVWNAVGERTRSVHGRLSICNKTMVRTHHISLCSNIKGNPQNIDNFIRDFEGEVPKLGIPPSMVQPDKTEQERAKSLNAVLFRDRSPPPRTRKYISLRLQPELRLFRSISSGNVFLAAVLDISAPEQQFFFRQIWDTINANVDRQGIEFDTFRDSKLFKTPTLHVSLLYGELNETAGPQSEEEVNESLEHLHYDELKDVQVCVDKVVISKLAKVNTTTTIPFAIEKTA